MKYLITILLFFLVSILNAGLQLTPANKDTAFLIEVAKGKVAGHKLISFFGHNATVGTTEETIMPCGGLVDFPSSASTMTLSSSDSADNQVGIGLRSLLIQGLDTDYIEISEILATHPTDGQLAATTINSYIRINAMIGITAGSNGKNAGIMYLGTGTITAGVPANRVSCMGIGANLAETGFFTVPAGKTGFTIQAQYGGESNKAIVLRGYQRNFGGLFLRIAAFNLSNQNVALLPLTPPAPHPAKSDLELRGIIDINDGDLKSALTMLLIDNEFL